MFTSEEEKEKKRERALVFVFLFMLIVSLSMGAHAVYTAFRPLPQTDNCAELGYEAGRIIKDTEVCYNKCSTKKISSCKVVRRLL